MTAVRTCMVKYLTMFRAILEIARQCVSRSNMMAAVSPVRSIFGHSFRQFRNRAPTYVMVKYDRRGAFGYANKVVKHDVRGECMRHRECWGDVRMYVCMYVCMYV